MADDDGGHRENHEDVWKTGDICCSWTFTGHARGFGFVTVEGMEQDVFIPEDKTGSALNGDKVQIVIESEGRNGRRAEGTVLKVLEHANSQLVGYYQKNKNFWICCA